MIFLLIYANPAGFRAPPLIEGCGLRFEGVGRMWEGTRTVGETRDEGDPSGASQRVSTRRNHKFRRPHPLSLPTPTQAGETCRFAAHIHPRLRQLPRHPHLTPYCRNCDRAIGSVALAARTPSVRPPFNDCMKTNSCNRYLSTMHGI